jgi:osmoprotectant transport system substrate-binding protein
MPGGKWKPVAWGVLLLFFAVSVAGAAAPPVVVSSKIDTEGALLGQMILALFRENGIPAKDRTGLGATNVVRKAILAGEIDLYPEYTGSGFYFFRGTDPALWKDPVKAYQKVKELDAPNGIIWLRPAPANNTWAIAARSDLAEKAGLKTLSDLARYMAGGGKVKMAASEEFTSHPDALPAFESAYGFRFKKAQLLVLSGGNTAQTERVASLGTDGVNLAMAYGTDGAIAALNLVVLEDDRNVQPVYEPAPILRKAVLEAYPRIPSLLDPVFASLDLKTLQRLNGKIVVEGLDPAKVATGYLREKGFLKKP